MTTARLRTIVAISAAALLLAGCTSSEQPEPVETAPVSAETSAPTAGPDNTPTPEATEEPPAELDCTSILAPQSVSQFEQVGWTSKQDPFVIAETELPGGIQCMWADFTVASGNLLLFAWAPIDDELAVSLQSKLVAQGMIREEGTEGVYITEDARFSPTVDEDGYGFTYLFGDGWVTAAETRASLSLIERP